MGSTGDIRLRLGGDILRAVCEQGGSREDVELVLDERPELVTPWGGQIVETAKTIRSELIARATERVFKFFRTVKIGVHKDAEAVKESLASAGCRISERAANLMAQPEFTVSQSKVDVDLVAASNAELEFPHGTTFNNTCQRALAVGLDLCLAEDGPALRGSYLDQPLDELLIAAMKPIADSYGGRSVFSFGHSEDGLWLYAADGDPQRFWGGNHRFVFRRRPNTRA